MSGQARTRGRLGFRLAWTIFLVSVVAWFVLRGAYQLGATCDLLIVVALAAQTWLLLERRP